MTMTQDALKRPALDEPGPSDLSKRPRLEQDSIEKDDLPPESSTRGKHAGKRDAAGWAKSRKGKEKQTKNAGRRRAPRQPDTEPSEAPKNDEGEPRPPRLPKRMTALLLGFCGSGCSGMQMCVYWLHLAFQCG